MYRTINLNCTDKEKIAVIHKAFSIAVKLNLESKARSFADLIKSLKLTSSSVETLPNDKARFHFNKAYIKAFNFIQGKE